MVKSKTGQRGVQMKIGADRAAQRRDKWIAFQSSAMENDQDHEKKMRLNYFSDPSSTHPQNYDFRPNSHHIVTNHVRQGMNNKNVSQVLKTN
jgi:hypothetical protein